MKRMKLQTIFSSGLNCIIQSNRDLEGYVNQATRASLFVTFLGWINWWWCLNINLEMGHASLAIMWCQCRESNNLSGCVSQAFSFSHFSSLPVVE
jgi:hypothetical protein